MFRAVKLTKNVDSDSYFFSGYVIELDARGSFSLFDGSKFGKNVIMFGADMSSSVHTDNKRKYIFILGKGSSGGLHVTMLKAEKEYLINFIGKQNKFCLSLHYNGRNSYAFADSLEIYNFKANDSEINASPLCLGFKTFYC